MKIVLIGFMGSGKTTVSQLLGARLGFSVQEMDALILQRSGRQSVNEIFDRDGEERFRALESEVTESLTNYSDVVVSTGGGIINHKQNIALLKGMKSVIVYLEASFERIRERIGNDSDRPLFRDIEKARLLYNQRAEIYRESCDLQIDTDGLSAIEVCERIFTVLEKRN